MKRITSFIPRNFPTMEKRVIPSSFSLGISKQKPMKRTIIRKHRHKKHSRKDLFFNKVVSYLLSDSYMYNPLLSPQPTFDFPPPKQISTFPGGHGDVALPIRGSNKKLMEKVVHFLEADSYLYSPLLTYEHVCSKSRPATPSSGHFQTLGKSYSTKTQGVQMKERDREGGDFGRHVVTGNVAYRASVKHMVRQNYCTRSNQVSGASLETDPMKLSVE